MAGLSFGFCLGAGDNSIHAEACRDYFQSLENDLIGVFSSWYAYSCPKEAKWLGNVDDGQPSVHRLLLFFSLVMSMQGRIKCSGEVTVISCPLRLLSLEVGMGTPANAV